MGAEKRARAERRRLRQASGDVKGAMERDGVFKRYRLAEFALQSPEFKRQWRAIATLREFTAREVQDLEGAHALALEVLAEMKVDLRDLTIKLQRRFNTLSFFCRPDATRFRPQVPPAAVAA